MAARKPKFKNLIICDDIRAEVGNKVSLMGVYAKDIFVPKFPYTFPKLCFFVNYDYVKSGDTFSVELLNPSGKRVSNAIKGEAPKNITGYVTFQLHAFFSPLNVEKEGNFTLRMIINDDQKSKKEIVFGIKQGKIN